MIKPIETYYNGYRFRSRLEARWAVFFDSLGIKYEYEPEGFDLGNGLWYLPDFRVKCYGYRGYRGHDYNEIKHDLCPYCKHNTDPDNTSWPLENEACECIDKLDEELGIIPFEHKINSNMNDQCYFCERFKLRKEPTDLYIEVKGVMTKEDAEKIRRFADIREVPYEAWNGETLYIDQPTNPILVVGNIPNISELTDGCPDYLAYDRMNGIDIYPFNYELIDGDHFGAYPAAHNGRFYLWGADSNYINEDDIKLVENAYDQARQARF